ncbi:hypothetical protein GALMADRAFT_216369 [Galerina marginata CBS 339.88]|uniref:Uncharacterized protein n=1 Tax=Galerina marginata (strain CBS 339.88) TaxID=685588 RepID=A0A067SII2_GALM3|nr:hypothetical protein GALMADRAFT_216369 [Galerina marginata CBS 339.88]
MAYKTSYFSNIKLLARVTTIWPHPEELYLGGNKVQVYMTLQHASLSLNLSVPMSVLMTEDVSLSFLKRLEKKEVQAVLKRDWSLRPDKMITPFTADPRAKLLQSNEEESKTWDTVQAWFLKPRWIIQPFIAPLFHVGEVQAFIINGFLFLKITTMPNSTTSDEIDITDMNEIRPLHLHKYDPQGQKPYTSLTGKNLGLTDFDDPNLSFESYVLRMLAKVIILEEVKFKRKSGLRIFCRMDVSVYRNATTAKHEFFVNEITRSHGACLFTKWDHSLKWRAAFNTFSQILHLAAKKKFYLSPPSL